MRGETRYRYPLCSPVNHFNPLPSCEGRPFLQLSITKSTISIHSPHARGDLFALPCGFSRVYFNPLPSCEGRRNGDRFNRSARRFQSTPLMRGETRNDEPKLSDLRISIHSPHARGDGWEVRVREYLTGFQSTPLMRGETECLTSILIIGQFQSTPLMRGETRSRLYVDRYKVFQSTPLMRGETSA